jgi:curved DNA-binding protein CbpA
VSAAKPRFDATINYYQVLNVPFGAAPDEIARAYRQLMRVTHPDQFRDPDERLKAEERAKLLNAAYAVLSKPEARQAYDAVARQTVMSDALMQRYTGNAPGRPAPFQTPRRPPSARVVRARKAAYSAAVRQLLFITTGFVLIVIAVALALALVGNVV